MTWIAPNNADLTAITGFNTGLGINPLPTFDWNVASTLINPIMLNFYVTLNYFIGASVAAIPILYMYYTNRNWTAHLPLFSNRAWDNTGRPYDITRVVNGTTGLFDADKYKNYSPPYIGAGMVITYFSFFAMYPAALMVSYLAVPFHGQLPT